MDRKQKFYKITAIALIPLALMVSGCTSTPEAEFVPPTSQSVEVTDGTATMASESKAFPHLDEVVDNGQGKYLQTTINDNDAAMKYDAKIAEASVKDKFSEEELAQAQKTVIRFIAEETIDSTVQGGGDSNTWFNANKGFFTEGYQVEVLKALETPTNGFLLDNPNRERGGYDLKYDEKDIRVVSRTITPTKISLASKDRPLIEAEIEYSLKTNDGKQESAKGTVSYAVTPQNDKWLISGYKNSVAINPVTTQLTVEEEEEKKK